MIEAEKVAEEQNHKALAIKTWSEGFQITTAEDYAKADKATGRMQEIKNEILAEQEKICVPQYQAWKAALAFFKKPLDVVETGLRVTKGKMSQYRALKRKEAEEREREEQRLLDEERKAAEAKIDAATEKLREAQAAEDKEAEDKARAEAAEERQRLAETPEKVESMAVIVPKSENTTLRKVWKFRIVDEAKVPHEYRICKPDEAKIRKLMNDQKEKASVPGVEFYEDEDTAMKGKRG
jgi:hypothetical protein